MKAYYLKYLNRIASYLKVPAGKLTLEDSITPVCTHNNKTIKGFLNIINDYIAASKSNLLGNGREDKMEIQQWIQYTMVYVAPASTKQDFDHVLKELNEIFALRTYLVSHKLSIADVLLYYALLNVVQNLTYLEKEKYYNVARWFDNIQQDDSVRQKNKVVDFSTNYLVTVAPARH